MNKTLKKNGFVMFSLLIALSASGCAGTPREKTAPCKRPANLTAYGEDNRQDCGSMALVNTNHLEALAAIDAMAANGK
ncbi:putative lipoprotein [Roseibium sp. TrichSKD4]|uniref:hypothetical protein n=1 Tax=Roseibium sp. TrichSKD4 TaxID=744980 RepID=UPI0001E577A5|nr:putative lipoprotein [Roseibium sp. TrichSKD4]